MPDTISYQNNTFKLEKIEIPVEYEAVDAAIENIWLRRPTLVVHCGVHGNTTCVKVEKFAYNGKYNLADNAGKYLPNGKAVLKNSPPNILAIACKLNLESIIEAANTNCGSTQHNKIAEISEAIGYFLCGYIYLKSLDRNCYRTLFLHVPTLNKPFSAEKLSEIVLTITEECLRQVMEEGNDIIVKAPIGGHVYYPSVDKQIYCDCQ